MNRLNRVENEIDTLNRAVYKGEMPPPGIRSEAGSSESGVEVRLQELEMQLRDMTGKIEQQSYDLQNLQSRLNDLEAAQRYQAQEDRSSFSPLERDTTSYNKPDSAGDLPAQEMDRGAVGMKTARPVPADSAAGQYEQAFSYLKSGDYGAAEKGFEVFLEKYPDHALSANAIYWLGETYYVRNEYEKAAKVFAQAYQKYPGGPKGADNLLKLGMSLGGMGKTKDACIALGQLQTEYPKGPTPVLRRAQQESDKLDCR
ncbi:MAG: tol-pal system protein YbgF [Rhodospirillales bacterium]|nr:tol-pal system protein YbgF [Alphaproteobacteria bacterium]USO03690.1 MAG: tol-pal system protein YbgF [Rhodospirillales bacterium]